MSWSSPGGGGGGSDSVNPVVNIYTDDAVLSSDDYAIANKATAISFTLPNATTHVRTIKIKNIGAGDLTINPVSSQLIDGSANKILSTNNAFEIIAKSGAWYIC